MAQKLTSVEYKRISTLRAGTARGVRVLFTMTTALALATIKRSASVIQSRRIAMSGEQLFATAVIRLPLLLESKCFIADRWLR